MNSIKECFDTILTADKERSRKAARSVRGVTYSAKSKDDYGNIKNIIGNAGEIYRALKESWRREDFVRSLSVIYFLRPDDEDLDEHFPLFFHLLQDPNGHIRYAAVRMLRNDLGPLTVHIRCPEVLDDASYGRDFAQSDRILAQLFLGLHISLQKTWESKFERYKYISELPSSPYKSTHLVLETFEEYCGEDYVTNLEKILRLS